MRNNAQYCSIHCPTCKKATRIETPKGRVLKGFKVYGVQLNCGYCRFKFVVAPTVDENRTFFLDVLESFLSSMLLPKEVK